MVDPRNVLPLALARLERALGVATPFPWQQSLLERMLRGELPSALDLPTGLGKTAVMAIWLAARAAGARLPRRLVYVVDRRAVVDQATAVAERLRSLVDEDDEFRRDLGLEKTLPISTLRGQFLDNREWLVDPSVPAIVLGTVDMIGSRLLFGGYAVSRRMRPYHAGLLGVDTLLVLDEAHLVQPFEALLDRIAAGGEDPGLALAPAGSAGAVVPRPHFLPLSATGRVREGALRLAEQDLKHPVVSARMQAGKGIEVRPVADEKHLAELLTQEAWRLTGSGTKPVRCLVYCNRRMDAQKVHDLLLQSAARAKLDVDTALFVGGRRVHERQQVAAWLDAHGFVAGSSVTPGRATFVIATSAGEVGIDLDADHMVGDVVAWERMVQRLGRVNRRGNGNARVILVPVDSKLEAEQVRLHAVGRLLERLPMQADGASSGSPAALVGLRELAGRDPSVAAMLSEATTPAVLHPPLTRPLVESWSMTSLEEHTGRPEIEPWLRGWIDEPDPQSVVVWRKHLPVEAGGALFGRDGLDAYLECAGPHLAERLETETYRVREWLQDRCEALGGIPAATGPVTVAVLLSPFGGVRGLTVQEILDANRDALARELAGATLLVDVRLGGLKDGLLDASHPDATDLSVADGDGSVLPFRMRRTQSAELAPSAGWRVEARLPVRLSESLEEAEWLVLESRVAEVAQSEEGRSVSPRRAQELGEHEAWAEAAADGIAKRLALSEPYAGLLRLAARLHDEGKRAERWQRAFAVPRQGPVLGKTLARPNLQLLAGYRHEFGSVVRAARDARVMQLEEQLRDLCLHLIAAHHGNARPLLSTAGGEDPPSVLESHAQEIALRFSRMEKLWGPWGLAWWESLLRAADQSASRRNDEEGSHG